MDWFSVGVGGSLLLGIVALASGYPRGVKDFATFIEWLRTNSDEWNRMQTEKCHGHQSRGEQRRRRDSAKKYD